MLWRRIMGCRCGEYALPNVEQQKRRSDRNRGDGVGSEDPVVLWGSPRKMLRLRAQ